MAKAMTTSSAVLLLLPLLSAATGMHCPKDYCIQRVTCQMLDTTKACPKGRYQPAEFQCVQTRIQGNACADEGGTCMCPGGKVDFGNYGEPDGTNHGDGYWTGKILGANDGTKCDKATFADHTSLPEPTKSSKRLGCRCHPAVNPWSAVTTQDAKPALCEGAKTGYEKPTCIHVSFEVENKEATAEWGSGPQPIWRTKGALNATEWMSTQSDQLTYELLMMGALANLSKQTHSRHCNFYKPSTTGKATATEYQAYSSAITGAWIPNMSYEPGIPADRQPGSEYCMTRTTSPCRTRKFLRQGMNIIVPDAYEAIKMWDEIVYQQFANALPDMYEEDPKYEWTDDQLMKDPKYESCWAKAVKAYQDVTFSGPTSCKWADPALGTVDDPGSGKSWCWNRVNQDDRPSFTSGLRQGWHSWNIFLPKLTEASTGDCPLATTATLTTTTSTTSTTIVTKLGTTPRPGNTDTGSVGGSTLPPSPDIGKVTSSAKSLAWSLVSASSLLLAMIRGAGQ